ncbi:MAG: hypothetical protein KAJ19_21775, partial [Gammaproteobacteria bacterium]|nr:hypothetical protein [Gammaproteobacteria bacterium]
MSEQLPPGYELDKVVAAKIMGWEFLDVGYLGMEGEGGATPRQIELADWLDKPEIVAITDHSVGDYFIDVASDMIRFTDDFQPSTDIAAAMQVWEKVASGRGWGVDTDGEKWWSGNQTDEMV